MFFMLPSSYVPQTNCIVITSTTYHRRTFKGKQYTRMSCDCLFVFSCFYIPQVDFVIFIAKAQVRAIKGLSVRTKRKVYEILYIFCERFLCFPIDTSHKRIVVSAPPLASV